MASTEEHYSTERRRTRRTKDVVREVPGLFQLAVVCVFRKHSKGALSFSFLKTEVEKLIGCEVSPSQYKVTLGRLESKKVLERCGEGWAYRFLGDKDHSVFVRAMKICKRLARLG